MLNIPGHKGNAITVAVRFHLAPVRMATEHKQQQMLARIWEK
jgi:hypothetical protein